MSLRTSYKARRIALRIFMLLILAIFIVWTVTPIYIIVSNSFRKTIEMKVMPPKFIFEPTFTHYEKILTLDRFGVFFRNSIIISCFSTFLCIMLGSLAAYGLKLFKSKIGHKPLCHFFCCQNILFLYFLRFLF